MAQVNRDATAAGTGTHTGTGTGTHTGTGTGTTSARPPEGELHRRFVLRVGGLPIEAVHRLRAPAAREWAERVLAARETVETLGARLSDPLAALVKAAGDDRERRAVLALRREVFNGRLPRDPAAVREMAARTGGPTGESLTGWLDARLRLARLLDEGGPLVAAALARTRGELRRLAREDRLRLGLALASPTLDAQLDAFAADDPAAVPDKRTRKKERSLLAYLYRTACKTSPFSTFTAVAAGRFTTVPGTTAPGTTVPGTAAPGTTASDATASGTTRSGTTRSGTTRSGTTASGTTRSGTTGSGTTGSGTIASDTTPPGTTVPGTTAPGTIASYASASGTTVPGTIAPDTTPPGTTPPGTTASGTTVRLGERWTSHPRLNVVVLARLAELIAADPERRAGLPVALSAGWDLDEDRVRYVRRSVTAGDDRAAVSFDAAHDRLFFLRRSGTLERLLSRFRDGGPMRYGELEAWLAERTGASAEEAARYPATLLDLGILQMTGLDTDVHTRDPLRAFQASLRALDRPWADATADRLEGAARAVAAYGRADAPGRRALLAELHRELLALQRELGAGNPSLPQTLLYEDVTEEGVTAGLEEWTRLAAEPLAALTGVLPAFDVALPQRLTLKGFFLARYGRGGRCDDLLRLVHDFHEDIFTQYLTFTSGTSRWAADGSHAPEENWLGMPEVTALDRARAEFTRRLRELWARHPAGGEELRIDEETVAAVTAELAPVRAHFAPHSHFVQLAARDSDPVVVLNNSYGGLSFPFTRFTHHLDRGPERGEEGTSGLTGELRAALRAWQPPGAVFAEITAGAATTNLNLHSRLTDYEIVCPGETGTAPPRARIDLDDLYAEHDAAADRLVLRSRRLGREVIPLYLGYLVPMVLPEVPRTLLLFSPTSRSRPEVWRGVPEAPATDGVTVRPRVRYRSLILHRRRWTAAPGALPVREPGMDDAAFYLAWQRWRHRHGLPDRVFATVHGGADTGAADEGTGFGGAKPHYVDFDSPLSLLALDGLTSGGRARTVFEEMLPAESELHVRSARGLHVAELAVEIVPAPDPAAETAAPASTPTAAPAATGASTPAATATATATATPASTPASTPAATGASTGAGGRLGGEPAHVPGHVPGPVPGRQDTPA